MDTIFFVKIYITYSISLVAVGVGVTKGSINFGVILDDFDANNQRTIYDFVNNSLLKPSYRPDIYLQEQVNTDLFSLPTKACLMASEGQGVMVIFGPSSPSAADLVKSFSSTLKIPQIQYHPDFTESQPAKAGNKELSINLWPNIEEMRTAYADLKQTFSWKEFLVITSNTQPTGDMAMLTEILTYDLMDGEEVIVKGVRDSKEAVEWLNMYSRYKNVLVDLPLTDIVDFVQEAHGMGFLSGYYHFHFTSLDMSLIAEEIGPLTKGAVNVTSFSLIDFDGKAYKSMSVNWHLKYKHADINLMKSTKNALIYDGVAYVSKVVANVVSQTPGYQSTPLSCDGTKEIKSWSSGDSLYQQLIENSSGKEQFLTGSISLDTVGKRRNFTLQLLEFDVNGEVSKVGHWNQQSGLTFSKSFDKVKEDVSKDFQTKTFKIAVKEEEPFVMIREFYDEEKTKPIPENRPNDRFYGFNIDMMKEIARELDMKSYIFLEVNSSSSEQADKTWTGIIGGLMNTKYDLGLSPITVNVARSEVVDFTIGYHHFGISILYVKQAEKTVGIWSFLQPFDLYLWVAIGSAFFGTTLILYAIGRFSPGQWDNPHPCSPEMKALENDLNPSNSVWFIMGCFLQQGTEIMPKSGPTRTVATFWWFFCLICVSSYTANLAAFLTKSKMKPVITSASDLANQQKIHYGCYANGTTREFFNQSSISTYSKMNTFMMDEGEAYNVNSSAVGVNKVKTSNGTYAYIMESAALKYAIVTDPECELIEIGSPLNSLMYSIALPKNSPYTRDLSRVVLKLKEDQAILKIYNYWWQVNNNRCKDLNKPVPKIQSSKLGLANFHGVFLVLGALILFGFFILIVEFLVGSYQASRDNATSFGREFAKNLKFLMNCCENEEKPAVWPPKQLEDSDREYNDDLYGSFGKLSLSIGSLNASTLAVMSEPRSSKSAPPLYSDGINSRRPNGMYGSLSQRSPMMSNNNSEVDLNITRDTEVSAASDESFTANRRKLSLKMSSF